MHDKPDMNVLYESFRYLDDAKPNFESDSSKDPIILSKSLQQTLNQERDSRFKVDIGLVGMNMLNEVIDRQIDFRHVTMLARQAFILQDIQLHLPSKTLLVGYIDQFEFIQPENAVESSFLALKLSEPECVAVERLNVSKLLHASCLELIQYSHDMSILLPVEDIIGGVYELDI